MSADVTAVACGACGAALHDGDAFCEACGVATGTAGPTEVPAAPPAPVDRCGACEGPVEDGYCTVCGVKAPTERDHWSETPAPWVAGVCDRGILHARNEDAMALAVTADGSIGVLVVCDGVTTAPDSDRAALAAARAACGELSGGTTVGGTAVGGADWGDALRRAARAANAEAVGAAHAVGDPPEPPSCTFVAAVVTGGGDLTTERPAMVHVAWCGDSRAYWVPDEAETVQLTVDHSLGTELIRAGLTQVEAEHDPRFHTITRWLGADSVDATPDVSAHPLDQPGYVAVVSDGLWNYASSPAALGAAVGGPGCRRRGRDPLAVAEHLVAFANDQGGHDNITAAIARIGPPPAVSSLADEMGSVDG